MCERGANGLYDVGVMLYNINVLPANLQRAAEDRKIGHGLVVNLAQETTLR